MQTISTARITAVEPLGEAESEPHLAAAKPYFQFVANPAALPPTLGRPGPLSGKELVFRV